jgi:hypothetical protein
MTWQPNALNGLLVLSVDLVTEQGPAISLAYERGEAGVMLRPPRNLATERLVSVQSVAYAYGVAGLSATGVCLLNYFMVFLYHGITPKALAFSVNRGHFQPSPFELGADGRTRTLAGRVVPDFVLPDGRVYGAEKQYEIHRESMAAWCAPLPCPASSAAHLICHGRLRLAEAELLCDARVAVRRRYLCVILCQFWNVWNCRTRSTSIFKHGLLTNRITIAGARATLQPASLQGHSLTRALRCCTRVCVRRHVCGHRIFGGRHLHPPFPLPQRIPDRLPARCATMPAWRARADRSWLVWLLTFLHCSIAPFSRAHPSHRICCSSGYFWLPQFASLFILFGYNESVKWCFRNRPNSWVSKHLQW